MRISNIYMAREVSDEGTTFILNIQMEDGQQFETAQFWPARSLAKEEASSMLRGFGVAIDRMEAA